MLIEVQLVISELMLFPNTPFGWAESQPVGCFGLGSSAVAVRMVRIWRWPSFFTPLVRSVARLQSAAELLHCCLWPEEL